MWNTLRSVLQCIEALISILTTLLFLYFLFVISDGRFRHIFWQPTPVVNEQPEQARPGEERPGVDLGQR